MSRFASIYTHFYYNKRLKRMNLSQDMMAKNATQHRHTLNQNTSQKSYCNDYVRSNIIDILTLNS